MRALCIRGAFMKRIVMHLRETRRARHMSLRRLACESGVSAAQISRIENGLTSPTIHTLLILSDTLKVPVKKLFDEI